ncbi:MAG: hypothetical protein ABIJ40_16200 [Bacteroidota bacterium]
MNVILLFPLLLPNIGIFAYFNYTISLSIISFLLFKSKESDANILFSIVVIFAILSIFWISLLFGSFSGFTINARDMVEFARIIPYILLLLIVKLKIQYNFARIIVWFFVLNILFCIFQYLFPDHSLLQIYATQTKQLDIIQKHRLIGFLDNPNIFSFYLIITYFFLYEKISLFLRYILFAIILIMISIVGSRTGFITFLIVILLLLLMKAIGTKRLLYLSVLTGIFYGLILHKDIWMGTLRWLSPYMAYGIDMVLSNKIGELHVITVRQQYWLEDMKFFYASPIFGVGSGYGFIERSYSDNTYVYLLARYGIVGLLSYLFSLFLLYKWARRDKSIFLYSVLVSFILFGLTAEVFLHNLILYYLSILFFTHNFLLPRMPDFSSKD